MSFIKVGSEANCNREETPQRSKQENSQRIHVLSFAQSFSHNEMPGGTKWYPGRALSQ